MRAYPRKYVIRILSLKKEVREQNVFLSCSLSLSTAAESHFDLSSSISHHPSWKGASDGRK